MRMMTRTLALITLACTATAAHAAQPDWMNEPTYRDAIKPKGWTCTPQNQRMKELGLEVEVHLYVILSKKSGNTYSGNTYRVTIDGLGTPLDQVTFVKKPTGGLGVLLNGQPCQDPPPP